MSIIRKIIGRTKWIVNSRLSATVWYNDTLQFEGCRNILNNRDFNYDVANLGSSSGYRAFNYACLGLKGLNLATPRQSLKADREMIKNYFSYLREGAIVLIPLCLFSSLVGEEDVLSDKYYVLLHNESIPNFSWKKKMQVLDYYNNPVKYFPCYSFIYEILKHLKFWKKTLTEEQFRSDAEKWIQDWKHEFSIVDFNRELSLRNKDSYESATKILHDIIEFCLCRNLKPVLVFPPISKYLSEKVNNEMRSLFINDFVRKANAFNIPFLNYLDDSQFVDDDNFLNAYILNEKGSANFLGRLISDLRKRNYLR